MKQALQKGVQALLFWALVPIGIATGLGFMVANFVPWLSNWAVTGILVALGTFIAVWRSTPQEGKFAWGRIVFLVLNLVSFGAVGYFQWQHFRWPMSPWLGAGIVAVVWIGVVAFLAVNRGRQIRDEEGEVVTAQAAPTGPTSHSQPEVTVTQELAAALGIPLSAQGTVSLKQFEQLLRELAAARRDETSAMKLREIREAVQAGLIDASLVGDKVCELCGIEKPEMAHQTASSSGHQPVREVAWVGDLTIKSRRRK